MLKVKESEAIDQLVILKSARKKYVYYIDCLSYRTSYGARRVFPVGVRRKYGGSSELIWVRWRELEKYKPKRRVKAHPHA